MKPYTPTIQKFLKGTVGGGLTVISALVIIGQPIEWKALLAAFAAGAFHGAIQAAKDLGWIAA